MNSYSGLFQTLAAAFNRASLAKTGKNALLNYVTRDFESVVKTQFDVINTNIVADQGVTTNLAAGSTLTMSDVVIDPGAVQLSQRRAFGYPLPNVDMSRGASDGMAEKLRDWAVKRIAGAMNQYIADLINDTNFTSHEVTSAGANTITDAKMAEAWAKLAADDIPVGDQGNFFLVTHSDVYSNLLQTASWTQNAYIGDISSDIRQNALLGRQWGAVCDWDSQMPKETTAGTYTSLLFHRNAIALVSRKLEPPAPNTAPFAYTQYAGIPILITYDWNQAKQQNEVVFSVLFGADVIREDHGCLMQST